MPTYTVRSIPVDFPYDAYDCQLVYMEKVIEALSMGQNALLESPTGTGKTLCLLCATLAWREHVTCDRAAKSRALLLAGAGTGTMAVTAASSANANGSTSGSSLFGSQGGNSSARLGGPGALATMGGGGLGVPGGDAGLSGDAGLGVLERNAGMGRGVALGGGGGSGGVAGGSILGGGTGSKGPLIIYASRTHSQLVQVIRELRATRYRPRMAVLGSREQMCIHATVSKVKGHAQNHMCRAVTSARSCGHHIRLQSFLRDHPEVAEEPMDIEDLVKLGRVQGPCPYFLSKELAAGAELLFMPYNYLIDPQHRATLSFVDWESAVLIFDEAHNLEGVCADAASFDLRTADLAACVQEVSRAIELAEYRAANGGDGSGGDGNEGAESALLDACRGADADMLRTLKGILLALAEKLKAVPLPPEGFTRPGPYILEFLNDGLNITPANVTAVLDAVDSVISALQDEAAEMGRKSQMAPTSYKLHTLRAALTAAMAPARKAGPWAEVIRKSYKVHIHNEAVATRTGQKLGVASSKTAPTLSYWCFNPGVAMLDFAHVLGVRSILLTSGTLSPMDSFAHELCL